MKVKEHSSKRRKNPLRIPNRVPLTFLAVTMVLYCIWFIWPAVGGLTYSFTNYRGAGRYSFIGLKNYQRLLSDASFWHSLLRTFEYVVCAVPLVVAFSLFIAVLVTSKHARGTTLARIMFFIPWLVSPIITGLLWRWMFGESFGLVNQVIELLGGSSLQWQTNSTLSFVVLLCATVWSTTAFNMLLFMTALKNVDECLYEAADLDGANAWQKFWHITVPEIAPTTFMVVLLQTISSIKEFAMIQSLNGGGPGTSNRLIVQYIYETGFNQSKVGYASAASMVLLVILVIVSLIQMSLNNRSSK